MPRPLAISSTDSDDVDDLSYSNRRRACCFCLWWHRISPNAADGNSGRWWKRGWNKVREWSELLAVPRLKTFLRRFNWRGGFRHGDFRYDPLSYAMNFDEGPEQNGHYEDDQLGRDLSCRYASFPVFDKSNRNHGGVGGDGPNFT